jgi:hypothetical protein
MSEPALPRGVSKRQADRRHPERQETSTNRRFHHFLLLSANLQLFLGLLALNHLIGPLSDLFKIIGFCAVEPPT